MAALGATLVRGLGAGAGAGAGSAIMGRLAPALRRVTNRIEGIDDQIAGRFDDSIRKEAAFDRLSKMDILVVGGVIIGVAVLAFGLGRR